MEVKINKVCPDGNIIKDYAVYTGLGSSLRYLASLWFMETKGMNSIHDDYNEAYKHIKIGKSERTIFF